MTSIYYSNSFPTPIVIDEKSEDQNPQSNAVPIRYTGFKLVTLVHVVAGCNSDCVFCAWQPAIVITAQTENNVQHTTANALSFVNDMKN